MAVDAPGQIAGRHVLVALRGTGVAMSKLALDEIQRLPLDQPVGGGRVAKVMQAYGVAQASPLERLLVPALADEVASQWLRFTGDKRARDQRDQRLADAMTLGDLALGEVTGDQVSGDRLAARAQPGSWRSLRAAGGGSERTRANRPASETALTGERCAGAGR